MSQIKEMLQPKMMMLVLGGLVMLLSLYGIMNGDEWAAIGWGGEENVLAHDAAYEEMWALHMLPLAVMAIITAVTVTGKELAKMAMYSPVVLVIIFGGMGYLTRDNGYGGTPEGLAMVLPLLMIIATILTGVSGYLHKEDE